MGGRGGRERGERESERVAKKATRKRTADGEAAEGEGGGRRGHHTWATGSGARKRRGARGGEGEGKVGRQWRRGRRKKSQTCQTGSQLDLDWIFSDGPRGRFLGADAAAHVVLGAVSAHGRDVARLLSHKACTSLLWPPCRRKERGEMFLRSARAVNRRRCLRRATVRQQGRPRCLPLAPFHRPESAGEEKKRHSSAEAEGDAVAKESTHRAFCLCFSSSPTRPLPLPLLSPRALSPPPAQWISQCCP